MTRPPLYRVIERNAALAQAIDLTYRRGPVTIEDARSIALDRTPRGPAEYRRFYSIVARPLADGAEIELFRGEA